VDAEIVVAEELTATAFMDLCAKAEAGDVAPIQERLKAVDLKNLKIGSVSALQAAVSIGSAAGAQAVLKAATAADVGGINSPDPQGFAPLHLAAEVGSADCVTVLVQHGADVEMKTADAVYQLGQLAKLYSEGHRSALHIAAEKCDRDVVSVLLAAGASPLACTSFGKTPKDLALEQLCTSAQQPQKRELCKVLAEMLGATAKEIAAAELTDSAVVAEERRRRTAQLQQRIQAAAAQRTRLKAEAIAKAVADHYTPLAPGLVFSSKLVRGEDIVAWTPLSEQSQQQKSFLQGSLEVTGSRLSGVEEPMKGVFVFPFFAKRFCSRMWAELMHYETAAAEGGQLPMPYRHDGSLELSKIFPELLQAVAEAARPAIEALLPSHLHAARLQHAFRTKNVVGRNEDFVRHVDKYAVTLNVCLHRTLELEGSGVSFYESEDPAVGPTYHHEHEVGVAILHSSKEWHKTEELIKGERGSLIMWFDLPTSA